MASDEQTVKRHKRVLVEMLNFVCREIEQSEAQHGSLNSAHEAYAVLLEEVEEFKAEVWKKREQRGLIAMRDELIQVAAVAIRYAVQLEEEPTHHDH